MTNPTLVCCLEERSAREMLEGVLPRVLPDGWGKQFIVFEGKRDLLKRLEMRVRVWNVPNSRFLILCDQDADNCKRLKNQIAMLLLTTGKTAKIRIACHELENFYLGDLPAVENGLGCAGIAKLSSKAQYRQPDTIPNAPQILKRISSFTYQKCSGSRLIASHLDIEGKNRSASFNALLSAIRELTGVSTSKSTNAFSSCGTTGPITQHGKGKARQ